MSARSHLRIALSGALLVGGLIALSAAFAAQSGASPQVTISSGGMEGLCEVKVQVHLAGGEDWRELVSLDDKKLEDRVQDLLRGVPGLTVVEGQASEQTPRVLVIAVGHTIADPQGNKDTAATSLSISLNQPVSVRRPLPMGRPLLVTAMTWHRSILITGIKDKMRERVDDKLAYLAGQFKDEYARCNPGPAGKG